jgi:hypothetical protein
MTPDEATVCFTPRLRAVDHAARYQLLDHATDESSLWDARRRITTYALDGVIHLRHRDRSPAELRPELERLLRDGFVELYNMADHHVLTVEGAIGVIANDANWLSQADLDDSAPRNVIYALDLTDRGEEEFGREYRLANPN